MSEGPERCWGRVTCKKLERVSLQELCKAQKAALCLPAKSVAQGRRSVETKPRSQGHRSSSRESFFFMKESGLYFPEDSVAPWKGFMQTSDQIRLAFQSVHSGWRVENERLGGLCDPQNNWGCVSREGKEVGLRSEQRTRGSTRLG